MSATRHTQNDGLQGLRTVAIALVLVGHAWPRVLPGGYIGVDVFFVLSGFLITGTLLRELTRDNTISIPRFYARRFRRLLPAASVVLLAVALAHPLIPQFRWNSLAQELRASVFYFQNWLLAVNAVDYAAFEEAASPLQHFWSLCVEEQFYILWPLLLVLGHRLTKYFRGFQGTLLLAILFSSFLWSAVSTGHDSDWAYFSSLTRAWELAAGGLLAYAAPLVLRWQTRLGNLSSLLVEGGSLGALLISAFYLNDETLFPGIAALAPVFPTLLLISICIARGARNETSPLLGTRPMVFVGDISYSLYLWHWPCLVLLREYTGEPLTNEQAVAAIAASFLLAICSTFALENPIRFSPKFAFKGAYIAAVVLGITVLASSAVIDAHANLLSSEVGTLKSRASAARKDHTRARKAGCHGGMQTAVPANCLKGGTEPIIALIGDSHASQWGDLVERYAARYGYRTSISTRSAGGFIQATVAHGKNSCHSCNRFNASVLERLKETKPEIIFVSNSRGLTLTETRELNEVREAYRRTLQTLKEIAPIVIVIHDTPKTLDVPRCLVKKNVPDACIGPNLRVEPDPLYDAAGTLKTVGRINLNEHICPKNICPAVLNDEIVFLDPHHLTSSFTRTLEPQFLSAVRAIVQEHLDD